MKICELNRVIDDLLVGKQVKGWKKYASRYRNLDAFYNKKVGLVVKLPACIIEHRTPEELRIPTTNLGDGWVSQPIALKTNLRAACEAIRKKLKNHPGIFPDVHTGNVGWYNGKPVLFDW